MGGIIAPAIETTQRVLGERRMGLLKEAGSRRVAPTEQDACLSLAEVFSERPIDLPFTMIYLLCDDGSRVGALGARAGRRG